MDSWKNRDPDAAESILDEAVALINSMTKSSAVAAVGLAYRVIQKPDSSIKLLQQDQYLNCPSCQIELARALVATKRWDEASAALERALLKAPRGMISTISNEQIRLFARLAKGEEARAVARSALKVQPESQAIRTALAFLKRLEDERALKSNKERYWEARKEYVYLNIAQKLMRLLGVSATTALDVGSAGTPTVMMFPVERRYSVDWGNPFVHDEVISHSGDYLEWTPPEPVHIASCMQTLEHIPEPAPFAQKLLQDAEVVIASVPHLERPRANPGHLHSMITPDVFASWFDREPNFIYIAKELSGDERMVGVWDRTTTAKFADLSATGPVVESFRFRWSLDGSGVFDTPSNLD